ncbi:WD repeat protein [Reticulomyxa filosa]|uniref:WD repeat protein n=1 Tax=Reticulomyxa filosa TaxID=46433 RepID=X6P3N1_RETFI|nr:WD repeat protein [Reticulomyxa filosa]|eukprot:ETO33150.1 WD repeat protein [Reticulomyxa filosa]
MLQPQFKDHLITNMELHFDLPNQMERDSQQEFLKYRADIELMTRGFNAKEKQVLSDNEKIVKSLKEKNVKLTQDYEQLIQKLNNQHKEEKEINQSSLYRLQLLPLIYFSIDYSTFDDCQFICSGSSDKTVCVWDFDNNKQIQSFNEHSNAVYCVKFSPYHYRNHRQNVIYSSSFDKTIRFWDFKDNRQLQIFNDHTSAVCGIEFSPFNMANIYVLGHMTKQFIYGILKHPNN